MYTQMYMFFLEGYDDSAVCWPYFFLKVCSIRHGIFAFPLGCWGQTAWLGLLGRRVEETILHADLL